MEWAGVCSVKCNTIIHYNNSCIYWMGKGHQLTMYTRTGVYIRSAVG